MFNMEELDVNKQLERVVRDDLSRCNFCDRSPGKFWCRKSGSIPEYRGSVFLLYDLTHLKKEGNVQTRHYTTEKVSIESQRLASKLQHLIWNILKHFSSC